MRWKSIKGDRFYTWDSLHGEVEVWNKRGIHLGAVDPISGNTVKDADARKSIDVK